MIVQVLGSRDYTAPADPPHGDSTMRVMVPGAQKQQTRRLAGFLWQLSDVA